jgi:2'-5' RNA ligase
VAEPAGIFIVIELAGPLAARIERVQRAHDPRLVALWPPHITLIGSSGAGPIFAGTTREELRAKLEPVVAKTPALTLKFDPPYRFPDRDIVVLPLDPHGPLRELHEHLKMSGLRMHRARYPFTPHCTLTMYPPLARDRERQLTRLRFSGEFVVDKLRVLLTRTPQPVKPLLDLALRAER